MRFCLVVQPPIACLAVAEPVVYQNYYETSSSSSNNNRAVTPSSADTFQRQLPAVPNVDDHSPSTYYSNLYSEMRLWF